MSALSATVPGMTKQKPDEEETEAERRITNIVLLVGAVILIGGGIWLVNALVDTNKLQQCFESGRRNCAPIEVPRTTRE